jgi:hypothetical protein
VLGLDFIRDLTMVICLSEGAFMTRAFFIFAGGVLLGGCLHKPIEVETRHSIEPIKISIDVNLKVDRELDDFFGDLDATKPN